MPMAPLSAMKPLESDQTLNPEWLHEQQDRLLGYEVLRAYVFGDSNCSMLPGVIAEKTGTHKFICSQALDSIKRNPATLKKLTHA